MLDAVWGGPREFLAHYKKAMNDTGASWWTSACTRTACPARR